jgi:hypothetical protein
MTEREVDFTARKAARNVTNHYRPYVEYEDMLQEARLWVWQHPNRVEHATMDDGNLNYIQLMSEIMTYLIPRAKRAKAQALGVTNKWQSRYTYEAVCAVLPALWDEVPTPAPGTPETAGRGAPDPAYGGGFQAAVMDVQRAYDRTVSREGKKLLFTTFAMGTKGREGAYWSGVPRLEIEPRVRRIVQTMVDFLNDEPWQHHEGPGSRHVMTNAQANAINEGEYGG